MTMRRTPTQHEVFVNPDQRNRSSYPYVAVLQSDLTEGDRRIVAPLARRMGPFATVRSRGAPAVCCAGIDLVVVLAMLGTVPVARLSSDPVGSIAAFRDDITRGLDWLFFGI